MKLSIALAEAEGPMRTQPAKFTLFGDGLCFGYDSGDGVSAEYKTPGTFQGGTIQAVGVTVEKKHRRKRSKWKRRER
jgi:hypothetical protein